MKKLFGLVALLALSSLSTLAQGSFEGTTPVFEIGGGYGFRSWGDIAQAGSRTKQNGWDVTAVYNLTQKIGVALDAARTADGGGNSPSTDYNEGIYTFMLGPRLYPVGHHKLTPYVHALAGLGRYTLHFPPQSNPSIPAFNYSENHLAFAFGGGIDATVNSRVAIRLAQVDYERTYFNVFEASTIPQNNFRFSAGMIVRFGAR